MQHRYAAIVNRNIVGLDDRYCFHSIRTTFASEMVDAGVSDMTVNNIAGWSGSKGDRGNKMLAHYAGARRLKIKREALEQLSYPGL